MILHLRYQADIWVEVDTTAADVLQVVVDQASMTRPSAILIRSGEFAPRAAQEAAERIADRSEWPSWDYGHKPV